MQQKQKSWNNSDLWEFNLTSIINSLTRFHPDFHHVGGEIKSGCDYKKKKCPKKVDPHLFSCYAPHLWKMILHISTLIAGWDDFWDFFLSHHLFSKWWDIFFFLLRDFFITFENRKLFYDCWLMNLKWEVSMNIS